MLTTNHNVPPIKVLVVEDNAVAAMMAKIVLEANGCLVDQIFTGREIFNKLNEHYDLLLLDIGLPDIDGFEVAYLVRNSDTPLATVPIVILTAHATCDKLRSNAKVKIDDYIPKPFTIDKCSMLIDTIRCRDSLFKNKKTCKLNLEKDNLSGELFKDGIRI